MAVFFMLTPKGEVLTFDSVTSGSRSRSNSLTKSSVMSGASVSDGYTVGNITETFSGICSYTKIRRNSDALEPPNPRELSIRLDEMIDAQEKFTLFGNDRFPSLNNVVITDYSIDQDVYEDAVTVTITVEQVFISNAAQKTRLTNPAANTNGDVTEAEKGGTGTKTNQNPDEELGIFTLTGRFISGAYNKYAPRYDTFSRGQ